MSQGFNSEGPVSSPFVKQPNFNFGFRGGQEQSSPLRREFFRLPQYYNLAHLTSPVHHSVNHKHLHIHQTIPHMKEEDKGDFEPTTSIDRRPSPLRQAVPNVQDTRLLVKRQDLHPKNITSPSSPPAFDSFSPRSASLSEQQNFAQIPG